MFSDVIKDALEREVVGQSRAVDGVVRSVTRLISDLTPRERTLSAHLFMGPSGTGKTHLVRVLTCALHGDESRVFAADCACLAEANVSTSLGRQLAPLFTVPPAAGGSGALRAPPLTVIRLDYLERASKEVCLALAAALDTGHVNLPGGRRGSLEGCLIFMTSALCGPEILDETPQIGFSGSPDEVDGEGREQLYNRCRERADERFGRDLMSRLDGMTLFHPLTEAHLAEILDRLEMRLNVWLRPRGFQFELRSAARTFLLQHGGRNLRTGSRDLVRAHQRFVEFPLADLLVSGRIPPGGWVRVDHRPGQRDLHFTVHEAAEIRPPASSGGLREVRVQ